MLVVYLLQLMSCMKIFDNSRMGKDFKEMGNDYCSTFELKIGETLFIKQVKINLNTTRKSNKSHLYN